MNSKEMEHLLILRVRLQCLGDVSVLDGIIFPLKYKFAVWGPLEFRTNVQQPRYTIALITKLRRRPQLISILMFGLLLNSLCKA